MNPVRQLLVATVLAFSAIHAHADSIRFLPHGDQSLAARLLAIQAATASIDLLTYEYKPCDSSTKLLVDAMTERAAKGIKVRIMVDNYMQTGPHKGEMAGYFAAKKIQFKIFNEHGPLNNRSHIKMLVIDGQTYFVGGRNSTDAYFGMSKGVNYFDQDLVITGSSASRVQARYNLIWKSGYAQPHPAADYTQFDASCMAKSNRDQNVADFITQNAAELANLPVRTCPVLKYTADNPAFINSVISQDQLVQNNKTFFGLKETTKLFVDFIAKATDSISMENQYYIPEDSQMDAFNDSRDRGVEIAVETNATGDASIGASNMTSDIRFAASRDTVSKPTNGEGQRLIMLISSRGSMRDPRPLSINRAPWRIHTKTGVRDHRDVFVSSYNIDPRSYLTNLESGVVVVNCPDLASDVENEYKVMRQIYTDDAKSCSACKADMSPGGLPGILGALEGSFF